MIKRAKTKWRFYKSLLFEIIETLCSICLYLESEGRYRHNPNCMHMHSHFDELKGYSKVIHRELYEDGKK